MCERFAEGAWESGHEVEVVHLAERKIGFCKACGVCSERGLPCPQKDDMPEILERMIAADVLVLATPTYFYAMSAQMKTLIDRCCSRYREIRGKDLYVLVTAADGDGPSMRRVMEGFRGFFDCLEGCQEAGVVYGFGVWKAGSIQGNSAMAEAYGLGKAA